MRLDSVCVYSWSPEGIRFPLLLIKSEVFQEMDTTASNCKEG